RELKSADLIELERGVNDSGITGGTWTYSLRKLLSFIDDRHADGEGVVFDSRPTNRAQQLYGLAAYYLVSDGEDALGSTLGGSPNDWWSGYDTKLGAPLGARYDNQGVIRRDFEGGTVLVNEPGAPTRTVDVGAGYQDLTGATVTSVKLAAASGAVLVKQT